MYYTINYGGGNIEGFNSAAEACAHTTGGSITVYWNGTLGNNVCLYLDSGGVTQLDGFNIFSIGGYSFGVDVCTIIDYAVCASSYTISWSNNNITTGTNNLTIFKNSSVIVDQYGLGSGSFSVVATDTISYQLSSTSPDYTEVQIIDSVHGTTSNCGFNSSSILTSSVSYTSNASVDGVTTNYTDACP
jgi:hypothetical protein